MGKHSKKPSKDRRKNPQRGGPGILTLCETGRESKCQREALEILRHYFYNENSKTSDVNKTSDVGGKDVDTSKSTLSLEEEIAMLKKGASADDVLSGIANPGDGLNKSPFRVYETGCRGTVFIMCTMPDSELIATQISTAKAFHSKHQDTKIQEEGEEKEYTKSEGRETSETCFSKTKRKQQNENLDITSSCAKKQKVTDEGPKESYKWDPIETVNSILQDIREDKTETPRSRFVSRMVPMQATCFASMEEIEANATELIKTFLLPAGIDHAKNVNSKNDELPSFKIEFKRRNCTQVRREQIVEALANIVKKLTAGYWSKYAKDGNTIEAKKSADRQLFSVDLKNPDYTIIIEVVRTLCGMSVVKNSNSYQNFNLMTAQESSAKSQSVEE